MIAAKKLLERICRRLWRCQFGGLGLFSFRVRQCRVTISTANEARCVFSEIKAAASLVCCRDRDATLSDSKGEQAKAPKLAAPQAAADPLQKFFSRDHRFSLQRRRQSLRFILLTHSNHIILPSP